MRTWQLQEAKSKFSQVVDEALEGDPQIITRHGQEVAVVLSLAEYRQLLVSRSKLSDFFRQSPLAGLDIDLARDQSAVREDAEL